MILGHAEGVGSADVFLTARIDAFVIVANLNAGAVFIATTFNLFTTSIKRVTYVTFSTFANRGMASSNTDGVHSAKYIVTRI